MKFLKNNLLAVISIAACVIVGILLALPGQFAHFAPNSETTFTHNLSGFQYFFNTYKDVLGNKLGAKVVGSGIAIVVMIPLAVVLACLGKKSSFFVLLASLFNLTISILFFSMESTVTKSYPSQKLFEEVNTCGWVTYVCGALIILVALYLGYKAVMMMKDEVKHPSQPKGPSYNYLKK